jgi:hypothetical protein
MGTRGPVPKRSNQRAGHRTKAEKPRTVKVPGAPARRPPADPEWVDQARDWYLSLGRSGQAAYYEPSDWQDARVAAAMLSTLLSAPKPSSEMYKAFLAACDRLGTTEGARRRMRIEVERGAPKKDSPAKLAILEQYRAVK